MKHIKLFEEFISESENDESVNESFLVTAAAAAAGVAGLMVLVKTAPFFGRLAGEASQMLGSAVLRKLEKDRLLKYTAIIDGIVAKFEGKKVKSIFVFGFKANVIFCLISFLIASVLADLNCLISSSSLISSN